MSELKEQLHIYIQGNQIYVTGSITAVYAKPYESPYGLATDTGVLISIDTDTKTGKITFNKVSLNKDYKIVEQVNSCKIYSSKRPKWALVGMYTVGE